jgi:diacylglycerol kinase (ATP)
MVQRSAAHCLGRGLVIASRVIAGYGVIAERRVSTSFYESFRCAGNGVLETIARERNMRVHMVAALAVALWGSEVRLELAARLALIACAFLVPAAEIVNTAFEALVDLHTRERREEARRVKDAAAGAVLVLAVGAVCVAGLVAYDSLPEAMETAERLGPLVITDVAVLLVAATLVAPLRRPAALKDALFVLGGALLVFVGLRTVCLAFTAMGGVLFLAIASASRWSREPPALAQREDAGPAV